MRIDGLPLARGIALLVPVALMAGALGFQFIGGLTPCEMCMWQRYAHVGAIALALLAFVVPTTLLKRVLVLLAGLAIGTSGVVGVLHAGVEYHWWAGFTPCTAALDPAKDILDQIQNMPLVRCDTAPWSLFGVSMAGFNALFSLAGAVAVLVAALWKPRS
ncbi:MAG: disulfide bond formation protein B [Novosphingobium sp.]|nr:disulfide bond formation protein B [Novosphingobium sp.]